MHVSHIKNALLPFGIVVMLLNAAAFADLKSYVGMCDASASLAVDESHFIMANDEDNMLRIYHVDQKEPIETTDLSSFMRIAYDDKSPESDIEGAAKIDDFYFFITSHGRDKKGRLRRNRHQFFAVMVDPKTYKISPVGSSYQHLMDDMSNYRPLRKLGIKEAFQPDDKKEKSLAPKERGVNIEGLSATAEGGLLIGFRNPIPRGNAIVVELLNPIEIITQGKTPHFGKTYSLQMQGRGVRSLEYDAERGMYVVVGGSYNGGMSSRLYEWDRKSEPKVVEKVHFRYERFNPEALHFDLDHLLFIFSDDGTMPAVDALGDECRCKDLTEPHEQMFRGLWQRWDH